jgi:hypothetical protein
MVRCEADETVQLLFTEVCVSVLRVLLIEVKMWLLEYL